MHPQLIWIPFLALLAPSVAAFGVSFEIEDGPIQPVVEQREGTLTVVATCAEVWERTPPAIASSLAVDVSASADHPSLILSGPSRVLLTTDECTAPTEDEIDATATYTLSATRNAPAFVDIGYELDATLEAGEMGENVTASTNGATSVYFIPLFSAGVDANIQVLEPDKETTYTFTIVNFGNAEGVAHFSFDRPLPDGVAGILPPATIVPYDPNGQDNTATATMVVRSEPTDGDFVPLADFSVQVTFEAAQDNSQRGEPLTLPLSLRIQENKGTPTPTPLLALPALVAAALLARRRA